MCVVVVCPSPDYSCPDWYWSDGRSARRFHRERFVVEASSSPNNESATRAMTADSLLPFVPPCVQRKKLSAAFDGALVSSDAGLVLLREAVRSLGLAETLAGCIRDRRNQGQVVHSHVGAKAVPALICR